MGGRNSAWLALLMHKGNLALQKDIKSLQRDFDRLYTEYESLCKEYNSVLEERNDLKVKHNLTTSSITTLQEYKSVLDERNALKVKHYYTTYALCELTNGHLDFSIQLYKAGELQLRIPYHKRDCIGEMVYAAFKSMKSARGDRPTANLEAHHAALMAE